MIFEDIGTDTMKKFALLDKKRIRNSKTLIKHCEFGNKKYNFPI